MVLWKLLSYSCGSRALWCSKAENGTIVSWFQQLQAPPPTLHPLWGRPVCHHREICDSNLSESREVLAGFCASVIKKTGLSPTISQNSLGPTRQRSRFLLWPRFGKMNRSPHLTSPSTRVNSPQRQVLKCDHPPEALYIVIIMWYLLTSSCSADFTQVWQVKSV